MHFISKNKLFFQRKTLIAFIFIFLIVIFLYLPVLKYFFFQDDWFVLNWVKTEPFTSFFSFRTDIIYYRPLSMPILFFVTHKIFELNPLGFHIFSLAIFFFLIIAVYHLLNLLVINRKLALLGSFFYAIWPIHFMSLAWFSTTSYIISPLFQSLSFILFINYLKSKKLHEYLGSLFFFILALASSEFALVLPLIFLLYVFYKKVKFNIRPYIVFFSTSLLFLFIRFVIFPINANGSYKTFLDPKIITNLAWYFLWLYNFPESFKTLIIPKSPLYSFEILKQFWQISIPVTLLIISTVQIIIKSLRINFKDYIFGFFWLTIGLSPIISVVNHSYQMYLSFAGIGFLFTLLQSLKRVNIYSQIIISVFWILASFSSLHFAKSTHWIRNEQSISKFYSNYVTEKVSKPENYSLFVFKPAKVEIANANNFFLVEGEDTLKQSFADQNAVRVIYNNQTLQSYFMRHVDNLAIKDQKQIIEISPR